MRYVVFEPALGTSAECEETGAAITKRAKLRISESDSVLDFLRTRFTRLDDRLAMDRKLDEIVTRLGTLERKVAGFEMDYAGIQQRLDNVDRRLDRIERRLDLVDAISAPNP